MSTIIQAIEAEQMSKEIPEFHPGDTVAVSVKVKEADITKTAQILVGDFLGNEYSLSKLYDKTFTHEYRQGVK